ncbi:MAG: hypothetical protein R3D98_15270 [Candidatus Krumholzibacteriia bacterium]
MSTTITFDPAKGPVTIEITSGHGTMGVFLLAYRREQLGEPYQEFGTDPKAIHDDIPDDHLIPIEPDELADHSLLVVGKYRPAYGRKQINVTYRFFQDHGEIHTTSIKKILPDSEEFMRFRHRYRFKAAQ